METTQKILDTARRDAQKSKRVLLIHFSASWCGWCKRLEAALESPEIGPIFTTYFLPVKLDTSEQPEKKSLENPDADKFMAQMGGAKSGLPFLVFLDARGKKLADSNVMGVKKENIGYPGAPEEIVAFINLLKKTSPKMKPEDAQKIEDYFKAHAPKQ